MTASALITLGLSVSLFAIVLSTGMATSRRDLGLLAVDPRLLLRSLVSMNVVAPTIAAILALTLPLDRALSTALVLLAISPVPPIGPAKTRSAGGDRSYVVSLLALSAMLSIALIPLSLIVLRTLFELPPAIAPLIVARHVAVSILIPLFAGTIMHALSPVRSERASRVVGALGTVLLVLCAVPLIIAALPRLWPVIGSGGIAVIVAYCTFTLLTGHVLGGPRSDNRTVLALASAVRHPGIAIALARAHFADEPLTTPAMLLCLLVIAVVSTAYIKASKQHATVVAPRAVHH
jgi:BASS family bile acid:Na+ symporter